MFRHLIVGTIDIYAARSTSYRSSIVPSRNWIPEGRVHLYKQLQKKKEKRSHILKICLEVKRCVKILVRIKRKKKDKKLEKKKREKFERKKKREKVRKKKKVRKEKGKKKKEKEVEREVLFFSKPSSAQRGKNDKGVGLFMRPKLQFLIGFGMISNIFLIIK